MPLEQIYYGLTGIALFTLGIAFTFASRQLLRRVLAVNITGAGLFLVLVAAAYRGLSNAVDPVPHALVLTGIVVAFSATALAIALIRQLPESRDEHD